MGIKSNKLNEFFTWTIPNFLKSSIKKFKQMSKGEQIAYCCIGAGLLLIILSLILFQV